MKYYKLTNQNRQTQNGTQWGKNITHKATGTGRKLCSPDVIHVYDHPLKAAMFNPLHANFINPVLWQCRVKKVVADDKLKVGVKECTTIRQVPLPEISTNQRVRFAILCTLLICRDKSFESWAGNWLSGKDRTTGAARAARATAEAAAGAGEAAARAEWAAGEAAARVAWAGAEVEVDLIALIKKAVRKEK